MLLRLLRLAFGGSAARPAAAKASGRQIGDATRAPRIPTAALAKEKDAELHALLDHCASAITEALSPELMSVVTEQARCFEASAGALNVFVYHVEMQQAVIKYRDVTIDTSRFDYAAVMQAFVQSVRRWQPDACIHLVTNRGSALQQLAAERVKVVALELDAQRTMNERVRAMCAYVHSPAFTADTLFLDSDAFLNGPAQAWLTGEFDVALTCRNRAGFMPVNEGVMAARVQRPEAVRRFFRRYLATYERLANDERVAAYYGDIRRWRGGQLSLNSVVRDGYPFDACRETDLDGVIVKALPADSFNYAYEYGNRLDPDVLAGKAVVHMKGSRKESLDAWRTYAASRQRDA